MDNLVKDYIDTSVALQRKYDEMKLGRLMKYEQMAERYKPIIEPLKEFGRKENIQSSTPTHTSLSSSSESIAEKYLSLLTSNNDKVKKLVDRSYGIREVPGKGLYIGNSPIEISGDDITIHYEKGPMMYRGTNGLWELLILQKPQGFDESDLKNYEDIALRTYVYKQNYDKDSVRIRHNRGWKYCNIIKDLINKYRHQDSYDTDSEYASANFQSEDEKEHDKTIVGSGLRKINTNQPVEYVYWNSIDELLERLCILYGQVKSGNTNPLLTNEIVNIIQELREI